LQAEGHHRGVAAKKRRSRATFKVVCHDYAVSRRLSDMYMAVNAAGHHELSCGVNYFGFVIRQTPCESNNLTIADSYICLLAVCGCDDRATFDYHVQLHTCFLQPKSSVYYMQITDILYTEIFRSFIPCVDSVDGMDAPSRRHRNVPR
jgi:hypothetical protein